MMSDSVVEVPDNQDDEFKIEPEVLTAGSFLTGRTLRSANLRKYQCMVISVLRGERFITNPEPEFLFQEEDTVWIAGIISNIEKV